MAVKAVVFDLYGTILDIDSLRANVAAAGAKDPDALVALWRRKQIEYAWLSTIVPNAYSDFDDLTLRSLLTAGAQLRDYFTDPQVVDLRAAWRTMPAYPDVAPALRSLAARGLPLAVLTNGTSRSANEALVNAGVRELLVDVLSVEAVRVYKPHPSVYALATERFACAPDEIAFVSSNSWDAWGAAQAGFQVAWCNRAGNAIDLIQNARRGATILEPWLTGLHELEALVAELNA